MHTDQTTVGKLLRGQTQYLVPVFQRPYVWPLDHVARLWQDILTVAEARGGQGGVEPASRPASHFLGSVVLAPSPVPGAMDERWILIDGQQRLTTLSVLFCAMRDHARQVDAALAEKIDDLYLVNKYYDGEGRFKLLPSLAGRASWHKLLFHPVGADGADQYGAAYRFFLAALRDDDGGGVDLAALERAVASQLDIIAITAGPDDDVHRIFESLNAGGYGLTAADLLRNHVLMRLGERMQRVYEQYWEPIEALAGEKLDELVHLSLVFAGLSEVSEDRTYQALQASMRQLPDEEQVEAWVVRLYGLARTFQYLADPSTLEDQVLGKAVERLQEWAATSRSTAHQAITVRVLDSHRQGVLSADEAASALRVVESYLIRRFLAHVDTKDNARNLRTLVVELGDRVPTASVVRELLSRSAREFPTDDTIRDVLLGEPFYIQRRHKEPRAYILKCIELSYDHPEPIDLAAVEKLSIEHVLPRNPSKAWWTALADDVGDGESVEDLHATLVHTLGNLTLTAVNAELGNDPFEVKRQKFRDSGLAMNREIATKHRRWGRAEIEARGRALTERVLRVWPGPLPAVEPSRPAAPARERGRSANGRSAAGSGTASGAASAAASGTQPRTGPAPTATRASMDAAGASAEVAAGVPEAVGPAPELASPGASARRSQRARQKELRGLLATIPAGRWTSFSNVGTVLGLHQALVGSMLTDGNFPNAHRVLKKNGVPADKHRELLRDEGVRFDQHGHAAPDQCLSPDELSEAVGALDE